jgi:ACS family hexuronate transporter-like MFS transporter
MALDKEPGTESVAPDAAQASSAGASATALAAEIATDMAGRGGRIGRYRWVICALLFGATTVNYMDRTVLGILAPTLTTELNWSEVDYANIISWFSFAYAFGYLLMGRLNDRIGVRKGYAISIFGWSFAAMGHAFVRSVTGFSIARVFLGITEGGNFPAAIKAVGEWFPKKERAFATGIFNAGTNVGAVIAPIVVPWLTIKYGWQEAFVFTGAAGFIWVAAWWIIYRSPELHPRVGAAELAYIQSDPIEPVKKVGWGELLRHRQTWAFVSAKFMTDPIWWFYLYWLPKFLDGNFNVDLSEVWLPLIIIYGVADFGSVAGGWISGFFMGRGWSVNKGRKMAMLIAALLIVPTMLAPLANHMWVAIGIVSVAAAAHQWWSANLFTTSSDMFPGAAVASIVGLGGFAGSIGAVLFQQMTGYILEATNSNYNIIFVMCGFAYVLALLIFHLFVPRLQQAKLKGVG